MTAVLRLLFLCLVGAVLFGVARAQPDFFNIGGLTESRERQLRESQRHEALARRSETAVQRSRAKQQVLNEIFAGRLTLLRAARQFKNLNETPITCQDDYRAHFPGRSDGEKVCRQVLAWLQTDLRYRPSDQALALVKGFEEELHDHLQSHDGMVVLPD